MPASSQDHQTVENFRYSRRVVLKSILGREDRGLGLVGQRVVVGGWVKSKRERKERSHGASAAEVAHDVSCCEVLLGKIPLIRCIAKVLARRDGVSPAKEAAPVPSVAYLRINDGSCVANLQV